VGGASETDALAIKAVKKDPEIKLSEQAQLLLSKIPEDGSHIGNTFLRSTSGWTSEAYWRIRQELLDNKLIVVGRGRGGSVARAGVSLDLEVKVRAKGISLLAKDEFELYTPLKELLDADWGTAAKEDGDFYWVEITGSPSGRKRESGKWSRPDVTFVQVSSYELIPTR